MGGGPLDLPGPEYKPHLFDGNMWLSSAQHLRKGAAEPQAFLTRHIASYHLIERGSLWFPAWLRDDDGLGADLTGVQRRPNLSPVAQRYLDCLGADAEDLSTTFSPCCTTRHTERRTRMRCERSGRASRFRSGRMGY